MKNGMGILLVLGAAGVVAYLMFRNRTPSIPIIVTNPNAPSGLAWQSYANAYQNAIKQGIDPYQASVHATQAYDYENQWSAAE